MLAFLLVVSAELALLVGLLLPVAVILSAFLSIRWLLRKDDEERLFEMLVKEIPAVTTRGGGAGILMILFLAVMLAVGVWRI